MQSNIFQLQKLLDVFYKKKQRGAFVDIDGPCKTQCKESASGVLEVSPTIGRRFEKSTGSYVPCGFCGWVNIQQMLKQKKRQ